MRLQTIDRLLKFSIKFMRFLGRAFNFLIKRNRLSSSLIYDNIKTESVRVFLKRNVKLDDFFKYATENNIRYVVLRWFERLPDVEPDEDIDILVHSDDISLIMPFFTIFPLMGHQKFDIYPSGYDFKMNFNNLSYFPSNLAEKILDSRVIVNRIYQTPDHTNHLLSLLFHVLFHKAERSSFLLDKISLKIKPEHDYPAILARISGRKFGSLRDIFEFLRTNNFLPSIDSMKKYAGLLKSDGLTELICEYERSFYSSKEIQGDCVMFVVRDQLMQHETLLSDLEHGLRSYGYEILLTVDNIPNQFKFLARGNNWGQGPYPISGGTPSKLIIGYNNKPKYFYNEDGFLQDSHIKSVKNFVRKITETKLPYWRQFNGLHTTDNTYETIEYASYHSDDLHDEIVKLITDSESNFKRLRKFKIEEPLTAFGRRADVYRILHDGDAAVLKVFKPEFSDHFRNEVEFYQKANENALPVPKLIEVGDNYLITEFIDGESLKYNLSDLLFKSSKLFEAYEGFVYKCFQINYFNADFVFANNIVKSDGSVIFYDFEFMQKYKESSLAPYEHKGIPYDHRHHYMIPLAYRENLLKSKMFRLYMLALRFLGI